MGSTRPPGIDAWLETFVARESQVDVLDGWVERVVVPVLAENQEVADDPSLSRMVAAAVRAHWLAFLASLQAEDAEHHLVRPAAEVAVELARQRHPATLLFRIYRVAQQAVWDYATTVTASLEGFDVDPAAVLVYFWDRASRWLDASVEKSVDLFQAEADRQRQGAVAQRLDAVRDILAGRGTDPKELSARLGGHPMSGFHTALVLHTDDVDNVPDLAAVAAELARPFGVRPLVAHPGGRDLWAWLATRDVPDLAALGDLAPGPAQRGITVAVGEPAEGVGGFRLSHHEAREAQRVAFALTSPAAVTRYADVELLAVMTASPEAARRFVARTLGPLTEPGETAARLRQTLGALLAAGSVDEAATRLSVHKNTIRYRVNQAEELLGRRAYDAPTETELALRYHEAFLAGPA
ncbi:PucR family transcriptional regulator [Nocardioides stalactiti]|uniref:PucR family transcriptional regulator n=1 Tax=Nocardioides stalactiti TaxID=2755356 RepID=UPI0016047594|nr:helix-turn-helix domain-containing protein [Nocardioides stalactiti]